MDLSHLHDDVIVAEMSRRLALGTVGYHGLFSPHQMNYRDSWNELCRRVNDASNDGLFADPGAINVRAWIAELANAAPPTPGVFALNTTRYGRDHAEQLAAEAPVEPVRKLHELPQDVVELVIAAREYWESAHQVEDPGKLSDALDKALEPFASRVPYENEPE